jgi:PDZ domain-containing protein
MPSCDAWNKSRHVDISLVLLVGFALSLLYCTQYVKLTAATSVSDQNYADDRSKVHMNPSNTGLGENFAMNHERYLAHSSQDFLYSTINGTGEGSKKTNQAAQSVTTLTQNRFRSIGAWIPNKTALELEPNITIQRDAIDGLLKKGFSEYYFAMYDFRNVKSRQSTEDLLNSTDRTPLRVIIIIVPPSEGGSKGNYDWMGWIRYFNSLKIKHPSFDGFSIDDFNWISSRKDTKFRKNVDFMIHSQLSKALSEKRVDVHFYPVLYFEGFGTNKAKKFYYNYMDGLILASTDYYNVTSLEHNLKTFSKLFPYKPIRYVVYSTATSSYIKQGYDLLPSDRLVKATLSISTNTSNGIILWRNIDRNAVNQFLANRHNPQYLESAYRAEKLQIIDENDPSLIVKKLSKSTATHTQLRVHNNVSSSTSNKRRWLGISVSDLDSDLARMLDLPKHYKGSLVKSVVSGGPAYNAGIRGESLDVNKSGDLIAHGDVIIAINGHKVIKVKDLVSNLAKSHGNSIKIVINRNGQIKKLNAAVIRLNKA